MRVVGGSARGRTLVAPPGERTRPTSDRVREAIFNALRSRGAVEGSDVLDLFAGSGALGVEALSQGAAHATFVDSDRVARQAVRRNLEACGFLARAAIVAAPAERFLARLGAERFDLAFCDPPYAFASWGRLLASLPADLAVIESDRPVTVPAGWDLVRESRYGGTWVGFATRAP
ncbi:MAG TPA: 16S rRNA (guanine(966)-N(2))-methyltransferase RsmD [Acidimicrobiales bacterium]|nr:16S rRNA (guanine(966)-N(2))-methyltransferase RsmD [Acidimicrobiales bacterium]